MAPAPPRVRAPLSISPPHLPAPLEAFLHSLPLPSLPSTRPRRNRAPAPPRAFRIDAWRWHHLAIEAQLHALSTAACPAPAALDFLARHDWDVHDAVEARHLAPLAAPHAAPAALRSTARARARLARLRAALRADLPALPPRDARRRLGALCGAAADAFAASEAAFVPAVAEAVSAAEQDRFNARVVRTLGRNRARIALVMFYDALFAGKDGAGRVGCGGAATRVVAEDRERFREVIPKGVRVLLPMWRRGFVRKYPDLFLKS